MWQAQRPSQTPLIWRFSDNSDVQTASQVSFAHLSSFVSCAFFTYLQLCISCETHQNPLLVTIEQAKLGCVGVQKTSKAIRVHLVQNSGQKDFASTYLIRCFH